MQNNPLSISAARASIWLAGAALPGREAPRATGFIYGCLSPQIVPEGLESEGAERGGGGRRV